MPLYRALIHNGNFKALNVRTIEIRPERLFKDLE